MISSSRNAWSQFGGVEWAVSCYSRASPPNCNKPRIKAGSTRGTQICFLCVFRLLTYQDAPCEYLLLNEPCKRLGGLSHMNRQNPNIQSFWPSMLSSTQICHSPLQRRVLLWQAEAFTRRPRLGMARAMDHPLPPCESIVRNILPCSNCYGLLPRSRSVKVCIVAVDLLLEDIERRAGNTQEFLSQSIVVVLTLLLRCLPIPGKISWHPDSLRSQTQIQQVGCWLAFVCTMKWAVS